MIYRGGLPTAGKLDAPFLAKEYEQEITRSLLTIRFLFAYSLFCRNSQFGGNMSIAQSLLPEFDQEMANTRKVLERVPDDKWNWKPHEKSGTTGWLAGHVGTVPEWLTMTLNSESLDYAPVDGPTYTPPKIENNKQLLAAFDKASGEARAAL